ncbi:PREDICTED: uncharacterized protein, partial [Prunus dulcis]
IRNCRQLGTNSEARKGRITNFLRQQGTPERGTSVSPIRAAGSSPCCLGTKTSAILLGTRDQSPDQPTAPASSPETRNFGPIDQMGDRTRGIRHTVRSEARGEGPGCCRFYLRAYPSD